MDPTAPNSSGGHHATAADDTGPTDTTVTLPPLTLLDPPLLPPTDHLLHLLGRRLLRHAFFDLASATPSSLMAYRCARPWRDIAVDPTRASAALVTCGGLYSSLNTVLRELIVGLQELYDIRDIFGVAAGYRGFYGGDEDHVRLDPPAVDDWHKKGGTVLKTTRGSWQDR
ncbi:ATP-dependent 6-phosphofructokinase 2-like [Setaria italica]|uniref:ATP-dependent 6-phosphofructokinase 2-like n=1 Tax=Setaria italica TaxID=4555 RepID=UPI000646C9A0|nr:ATP-dependent 6-phosphofructokinase 2-like [Setaria italica]